MIYITGDTHGEYDIKKLNTKSFPEQKDLTKKDYLIVCGDFGLLWDHLKSGITIPSNPKDDHWQPNEIWLKDWYDNKNFTTLFVDGNHENFARLNSYPVEEWHGGKVQKITDSIIHLMRGQVFEIDGYTIFTMGGANSHDRGPVTYTQDIDEGICWWPEEKITKEDMIEAQRNLAKHNYKVDFVITHDAPAPVRLRMRRFENDDCAEALGKIMLMTDYKVWYAGHHHTDEVYGSVRLIYNDIVKLGEIWTEEKMQSMLSGKEKI